MKDFFEQREYQLLSPFAAKSAETRGRLNPISPCDLRTEYQRDRDRIIHSKSFRRLKHKTQVFLTPTGDHYRTRLTHTLEVSQIARTIARALMLNEDLAEAIALGHDLGHTPFGHAGERVLNGLMAGGFEHCKQSLRTVDILENLNLTYEVRNGILCHTAGVEADTLEGRIVRYADKIAYINHDIDDSIRAGIITQDDLPRETLVLGDSHGKRIDTMVRDIIFNSHDGKIAMSEETSECVRILRKYLFENIYNCESRAKLEESKAEGVVRMLFEHYIAHPEDMQWGDGSEQSVCDYISCMSDVYALDDFKRIFIPAQWGK